MRFGGRGNWGYLTRAAALACAALFVAVAPASAATTRYAVPAGGLTSGTCASGSECSLDYALQSAGGGDTVSLAAGSYAVTAPLSAGNVDVRGNGSATTKLLGAVGLGGPVLSLDSGATVHDLQIESRSASPALDLTGSGDGIEVYSSVGDALTLRGGSDLNNSVAHTSAASATALRITGGLLTTTTVRHSTVVATGSGSKGLDASGILASPSVRSSIVNGIASDVVGDVLNPVGVSYSAYRTAKSSNVSGGAGNRNAIATFVDAPARNFQQDATSPTVNTGENSDAVTLDLGGRPRTIAEGTDIGAYELPIAPNAVSGAATSVAATTAHLAGTVNPRATATTYVFRYGTTSPPATSTGSTSAGSGTADVGAATDLTGLSPGTTYYYRVSATSTWGTTDGAVGSFNTPSVAPTAVADVPSPVDATSARFTGTVNPGGALTSAKFQWGDTASYGSESAGQALTGSADASLTPVTATGLNPGTQYHYRIVATNANGTTTTSDATFTTPTRAPVTAVVAPTGLSTSTVTLGGSVDPGGATTTWKFEYGIGGYDQTATGGNVSGTTTQAVSKSLTGLLPGTSYSYRLVAQNTDGTVTSTGTFSTSVAAPTASTGGASAVTARGAHVGGTLNPGGDAATYRFQYGEGGAYNRSTAPVSVADGTDDVAASANLSGLEPGTVYDYRLVVANGTGTTTGSGATFTTAVALPGVSTDRANGITTTGARLLGAVNPGGGSTTWSFEYGRTSSYGHSTAPASLTAGNDDESVALRVEDLEPGATYHFRLVAHNAAGDTLGDDATFTTVAQDPDPATGDTGGDPAADDAGDDPNDFDAPVAPVTATGGGPVQADGLPAATAKPPVGRATNAAPAAGTVKVQVPGSDEFVELTEGASIPVGSVVDATEGEVTITSAADSRGTPQSANFGGSEFKVLQRRAAKPVTDIVMTGGDFSDCFPRALSRQTADVFGAARRKWSRRRLWGNGHGRFRTRGRHGTATVRGTHWLTEDRCDGTLVRVKRGLVEVRDLDRRRTVMVGAGEQYFARSLEAKRLRSKSR
jgi:phosphodiesterase/alkaline phosphatase D-like protein